MNDDGITATSILVCRGWRPVLSWWLYVQTINTLATAKLVPVSAVRREHLNICVRGSGWLTDISIYHISEGNQRSQISRERWTTTPSIEYIYIYSTAQKRINREAQHKMADGNAWAKTELAIYFIVILLAIDA